METEAQLFTFGPILLAIVILFVAIAVYLLVKALRKKKQ